MSRFKNPHLRTSASKSVCRREVFSYQADKPEVSAPCCSQDQLELLHQLNETLEASLHSKSPSSVDGSEDRSRSKRRRIVGDGGSQIVWTEIAPREPLPALKLISNQESVPITLEPRPPKPPKCYRERDYEDDRKASEERRRRAQAAAVDLEWLIHESKVPHQPFPASTAKECRAIAKTPLGIRHETVPPIALFETVQPLRKTRPPVPVSELVHHPYKAARLPLPMANIGKGLDSDVDDAGRNQRIPSIEIVWV
ncbi:hypothetical protein E1B28_012595 [Marasmius oreades]|uniref:Uncharacterized protein n=1 Tax=Marasmius oreades TaxID=181124 RepID=A0A9P7UNE6_9AGAR|nr:uncharacterized protein E1B28_012595 [Marasmius oreades]KAG7088622.1 hypothetical protein E1B28_012595 [Marasmius oreades]